MNQQSPSATDKCKSKQIQSDRKFNVVISGVEECIVGTPRLVRLDQDLERISGVIASVDSTITSDSIRDIIRLGKFNSNCKRPRPILVKFLRYADAAKVLFKAGSLCQPYTIKPDMSKEQRVRESVLLKERLSLIQSGIKRKSIKIHNSRLFVNNVLHGKVDSSNIFQLCQPNSIVMNQELVQFKIKLI